MQIAYDCLPCFVRHCIEVVREFSDDEKLHEQVIRNVLRMIAELDLSLTPPELSAKVHAIIRDSLGCSDPYLNIKKAANALAENLSPTLEARVAASGQPMRKALLFAIAGNIIDSGISMYTSEAEVLHSIELAESATPAIDHSAELLSDLSQANQILILADNAGELVFDRLLLKRLASKKLLYAVKGAPIVNDALREDAISAGLDKYAEIIDSGVAMPGTVLAKCSGELQEAFARADVILAKGQANYETLGGSRDRRLYFALRAKCNLIAGKIGVPLGSFVVLNAARQKS